MSFTGPRTARRFAPASAAPRPGRPLRVIVADDDPLARRAIHDVLGQAGALVVADVADGHLAVESALHHRPDVLLVELDLPGLDAAAVARRVVTQPPGIHVVVLSASSDEEAALRALHAGASGVLSKAAGIHQLQQALAGVVRGEAAISRRLSMRLIELYRSLPQDGRGLRPIRSKLTNREWEVMDLLVTGASTQEVAQQLVLTLDTVYTHVKNSMRKLGVHSRAELIQAACAHRHSGLAGSPEAALELSDDELDAMLQGAAPARDGA